MRESASPLVAPSSPPSAVDRASAPSGASAHGQRATPSTESAAQSPRALVALAQHRSRTLEGTVEPRAVGIGIAVAIHAALLLAVWNYAQPRTVVPKPAPIVVQLLTPPRVEPPPPSRPPAPRLVAKPSAQPTPRIELPPQVDLPAEAAPIITIAPPPKSEPPPAVTIAAPSDGPPTPQPSLTPPRFDADYLKNPPPEYPPMARRRSEQGRVLLRVLVGADGDPREIAIKISSGFERLDRAAQDTVRRWRFVPARMGTLAVDAWVIVPIVFALTR